MDSVAKAFRQADNVEADLLKIAERQMDGYITDCRAALNAIAAAAGNIIDRTAFGNPDTTNNRMELQAVIPGILLAAQPQVCDGRRTNTPIIAFGAPSVIYTDSI